MRTFTSRCETILYLQFNSLYFILSFFIVSGVNWWRKPHGVLILTHNSIPNPILRNILFLLLPKVFRHEGWLLRSELLFQCCNVAFCCQFFVTMLVSWHRSRSSVCYTYTNLSQTRCFYGFVFFYGFHFTLAKRHTYAWCIFGNTVALALHVVTHQYEHTSDILGVFIIMYLLVIIRVH